MLALFLGTSRKCRLVKIICLAIILNSASGFCPVTTNSLKVELRSVAFATKGFGGSGGFGGDATSKGSKKKNKKNKANRLKSTLEDKPKSSSSKNTNTPYVKSEQDAMLESLAAKAANTCIGKAVSASPLSADEMDSFWQLMPSLINSRFPDVQDKELERVAGMVRHTLDPNLPIDDEVTMSDPHLKYRPLDELHAYMPGLGPTQPFHDPSQLELCRLMSENYDTIKDEYEALIQDKKDRFQSVTSMNYESGWKTMVLFYNGHRIPDFPYHLCPTTTKILETVPIAGRIAGFNRQQPSSGIPLHTDGNNMWLTCQMGIYVPEGEKAHIRVGPETRHWKTGECLLYDTTYEHETFNEHPTEERVVLHVDFFNTLSMTRVEIEILQYIYSLREEFMKAEGVSKVGKQIL